MNQMQRTEKNRESATGTVSRGRWVPLYAIILGVAVACMTPDFLFGNEQSHRKLAEEYMVITDTEKMMMGVLDQVRAKQLEKLDKVAYHGKSPKKDKELKDRVAASLDKKLRWSNFREGYINVYAEIFTEEELKTLVDFYRSDLGKKVLSSSQDLRTRLLQSTQVQLKDMVFDIRKIEQDFVAEQKKRK